MIEFWIIIAIMTLIAVAFILLPSARKVAAVKQENPRENIAIYKEQLAELEAKYKSGELEKETYHQAKQQLELNLLHDVDTKQSIISKHNSRPWFVMLATLIILPAAAITLYLHWGDSKGLSQYMAIQNNQPAIQKTLETYNTPTKLIDRMQQILANDPDSAKGWYLLGKLYTSQNQYKQAVEAFDKANQLKPNQVDIQFQYASALFFLNKNTLNQQAKSLIDAVLKQEPNNPQIINLLAMDAFNRHEYQQAADYWEQILPTFSPESQDGKAIMSAIAEAQKLAGES